MSNPTYLAAFIKDLRKRLRLTQEELAERAGVGLRFIRDLEQGKTTLRMDKVNQVLALGGYSLVPSRENDPYDIYRNHINKPVKISLKHHRVLDGVIIDAVRDAGEITGWKFVPNNKALEYQQTNNEALVAEIRNRDITRIENI
jgi:y4mF family transcriptional regulator